MPKPEELGAMSEHYRNVRKAVYEQATMPFDGSMHEHELNKEKLRQKITALCNAANLDHYIGNSVDAALKIWRLLWTVNRYAGIKNTIASKEIEDIAFVFDHFEVFCEQSWEIEANGHCLKRAGADAQHFLQRTGPFTERQTIGNIPKLCKIVNVARGLKKFLAQKPAATPVLDFITKGNPTSDVWAIHKHLMSIGYTSDLTALHFMMDLGFPVIKPDIVITRLFLEWGWLHKVVPNLPPDVSPEDLRGQGKYRSRFQYTKPIMYKPVIELARQIVGVTSQQALIADIGWNVTNPLREFDIFTVTYGQVPDKEWGLTRTLYVGGASASQCTMSSLPKSGPGQGE
jgi:hypothetical protein